MSGLSRRRLLQGVGVAGLGLLAGCGRPPFSLPFQTQQPQRLPRLGVLSLHPATRDQSPWHAFRQGLRDLGYVEGHNVVIEWHAAEAAQALSDLAAGLVQRPVDVIVTEGATTAYARAATGTIPIVFALSADPIGAGYVASLARPGGNLTGLSTIGPELSAKRLELLKAGVPGLGRVDVLWHNDLSSVQERQFAETQGAATILGLEVQSLDVQELGNLEAVFEVAARDGAQGLVLLGHSLFGAREQQIAELAAKSGLPAMYPGRGYVAVGGLMAYGVNTSATYQRAATYVDRILKGTKPADLPVEQPREFDFVINLKTARALGLTIPPHVLLQATEIIE